MADSKEDAGKTEVPKVACKGSSSTPAEGGTSEWWDNVSISMGLESSSQGEFIYMEF